MVSPSLTLLASPCLAGHPRKRHPLLPGYPHRLARPLRSNNLLHSAARRGRGGRTTSPARRARRALGWPISCIPPPSRRTLPFWSSVASSELGGGDGFSRSRPAWPVKGSQARDAGPARVACFRSCMPRLALARGRRGAEPCLSTPYNQLARCAGDTLFAPQVCLTSLILLIAERHQPVCGCLHAMQAGITPPLPSHTSASRVSSTGAEKTAEHLNQGNTPHLLPREDPVGGKLRADQGRSGQGRARQG